MRISICGALPGEAGRDPAPRGAGERGLTGLRGLVEHAEGAAAAGFSAYWVAHGGRVDALVAAAVIAARVPGIELGTAIVPTWTRHPATLAVAALTTQDAAGGRLTLGIGPSHQRAVEGEWRMRFERPVRHVREYLDVLVPLLAEGRVHVEGETLGADLSLPGSPEVPAPPLLLAAVGPQMLRLAGSRADGVVLWMVGADTIRVHVHPPLADAARDAGRRPPRLACALPVCVTDDPRTARDRIGTGIRASSQPPSYRGMVGAAGDDGTARVALVGPEAAVIDGIGALAAAGVTELLAVETGASDDERRRTRGLLAELATGAAP